MNINVNGIKVEGHRGTWYVIAMEYIKGERCFLLESEKYGSDAPNLIINAQGTVLLDEVWNGFDDYREYLEGESVMDGVEL